MMIGFKVTYIFNGSLEEILISTYELEEII